MSWALRAFAVAVVLTVLPVSVGLLRSAPEPTPPLATPLGAFDTTHLAVRRRPFCDRIPAADVAQLVGTAARGTSWSDGDKVPLGASGTDVAHEFGCSWTASGDRVASAWVFAPPVMPAQAASYGSAAAASCTRLHGRFGAASVGLHCGDTWSWRGLFGDAWLVCTLAGPHADAALVGRWCVSVARSAA